MSEHPFGSVRDLIQAQMLEQALPSLAVAVARNGQILWEEAFGWADRERRVPATPHTLYSLASISKPVTATALMILKEQAKLELDRPVNDYLGEAGLSARVGKAQDATVRRLANHTAGLPTHFQFFYEDEPYRRPPMHETIRRYGNLFWAPGQRYEYSNLGYGLLDHIISRQSGRPYADFLREQVFLPLGMIRSCVNLAAPLEAYQAVRYGADGVPYPFYDFDHPGGSAVFASAHDLARFGLFHLKSRLPDQKPILPDAALEEMQAPTARTDAGSGYGIGWAIEEDDYGLRSVSHNGGMGGVNTCLKLFPSEGLAIAVLANANTDLPYRVQSEIAAALLPEYAARRGEEGSEETARAQQDAGVLLKPAPGLRGEWAGSVHTYQGEVPFTLWFQRSGDIHAQLGSELKTLVNDARFREGTLSGTLAGDLGTEDTRRMRHRLHLRLTRRRGNVLSGLVLALYHNDEPAGGAPARRMRSALGHWAQLSRSAQTKRR